MRRLVYTYFSQVRFNSKSMKNFRNVRVLLGASVVLTSAVFVSAVQAAPRATITSAPFGQLPDGRIAKLYTLTNSRGEVAKISNYGGIITSLMVPDKKGRMGDIALGYSYLADYLKGSPYFGAIVGRYGNRIDKGRFTLDGKTYQLARNNGPNHLHGGNVGIDKRLWTATPRQVKGGVALDLVYFSPAGEEGYPGNVNMRVVYTFLNTGELRMDYRAVTDKATPFNPTNHAYWNLEDGGRGTINNHLLQINARRFTPVDSTLIPTGKHVAVAGTPFDFTKPMRIGKFLVPKGATQPNEQLRFGMGYDHNFVLNNWSGDANPRVRRVARVTAPNSGRTLTILTDQPGLQFYGGNFLDGTNVGKNGTVYNFRNALVLEAQHFPDSPNQPNFPSTILRPGQTYHQTTIYKFGVTR